MQVKKSGPSEFLPCALERVSHDIPLNDDDRDAITWAASVLRKTIAAIKILNQQEGFCSGTAKQAFEELLLPLTRILANDPEKPFDPEALLRTMSYFEALVMSPVIQEPEPTLTPRTLTISTL